MTAIQASSARERFDASTAGADRIAREKRDAIRAAFLAAGGSYTVYDEKWREMTAAMNAVERERMDAWDAACRQYEAELDRANPWLNPIPT